MVTGWNRFRYKSVFSNFKHVGSDDFSIKIWTKTGTLRSALIQTDSAIPSMCWLSMTEIVFAKGRFINIMSINKQMTGKEQMVLFKIALKLSGKDTMDLF
jgi:hypothetical protein